MTKATKTKPIDPPKPEAVQPAAPEPTPGARRCPTCTADWTPEMLAKLDAKGDLEIKCKCGAVVVSRVMGEG